MNPDKPPLARKCLKCSDADGIHSFFMAVSAPVYDDAIGVPGGVNKFKTGTIYLRGDCCDICYETTRRQEKRSARVGTVVYIVIAAIAAIIYFAFPEIPHTQRLFMAMFFFGVCYGTGWVIYSIFAPPANPTRDDELTKIAKRLSRQHLRNATPTISFLTFLPSGVSDVLELCHYLEKSSPRVDGERERSGLK